MLLSTSVLQALPPFSPFMAMVASPFAPEDDLKYPIEPRKGDHVTAPKYSAIDLEDPSVIEKEVSYDPETKLYVITEKVGGINVKPPVYLTYEEYIKYVTRDNMQDYWRSRDEAVQLIEEKGLIPPIKIKRRKRGDGALEKLGNIDASGGGIDGISEAIEKGKDLKNQADSLKAAGESLKDDKIGVEAGLDGIALGNSNFNIVEIRPQGNVDLTLGMRAQRNFNPALTERQQRGGGPSLDFDMDINMNVIGKIGDVMDLNIKYNTQSTFDFDNQIKLEYNGKEDDIIKKIRAGNVSMPLNTQLISGSQSLFGVLTELQFGRLTMTTVLSRQEARKESVVLDGGAQVQDFEILADQYDQNRHFFLGHPFRDNYNAALSNLPNINSLVNITRIEVWKTNRQGSTADVRDVVGYMDLGEPQPFSDRIQANVGAQVLDNSSNDLYQRISNDDRLRSVNTIVATLQSSEYGLEGGQDFERTYARKLSPSEFNFDPLLGYLSLRSTLGPNEVLAVAFQYTINGEVYQVGEFANDIPSDSAEGARVLQLKMLKGSTIRTQLPIWHLMMKNIYSLGAFQVSQKNFRLDMYYQDPGGGEIRYLPQGNLRGVPLIKISNLDNLNPNNDPQPDGVFDFVPGITLNPSNGRLIFPVLEPFGDNLRDQLTRAGDEALINTFVFDELYDSTFIEAQQVPEKNRFLIKGQYESSSGSDISLGAFNIPEGSVQVSMGGQRLQEGIHYTVDYNLGRVKIIDEGIINSGIPVKVDFENGALFGFQQKSLIGTRLDYRVNNQLQLGGTVMRLSERPFSEKVNIGEDPIANTIYGFDLNYSTEAPVITRLVDKLPIYSTKETSTFTLNAEVAYLNPGHPRAINIGDDGGQVYIDDFEGTSSGNDIRFPLSAWRLASTPRNAVDGTRRVLFPEANSINELEYGVNRADMSWYSIALDLLDRTTAPDYLADNEEERFNVYTRAVQTTDIYPNRQIDGFTDQLQNTFDLAYYPNEKGPYNFEAKTGGEPGISRGLNEDGTLKDPASRWGGIMRGIDNNDFEAANIEFIEFWMLDPFIENPDHRGGEFHINLGTISEDILRDSRLSYENGLKENVAELDQTAWANVAKIPPLNNAFDNNPNSREYQDLGYDGLTDEQEQLRYAEYLNELSNTVNGDVLADFQNDPSQDNYVSYLDGRYNEQQTRIIDRYREQNRSDGNSPINDGNTVALGTTIPDIEDINRDNTLNELEEYFQYRIPINPDQMSVENNRFIVSENLVPESTTRNGTVIPAHKWFQFKIPIREFTEKIGNIPDFKSIQFMRMFLTDFEEPVVMRFATMELIRNQWRQYEFSLAGPHESIPTDGGSTTTFDVFSVGLEENSAKEPVPYRIPPGIVREEAVGTQSNNIIAQNEQSLALRSCNLPDGDAKAVFKTLNFDFRNYKRLRMFLHAETPPESSAPLRDKEVTAFIRLGTDFKDNYYQYELPLEVTPDGSIDENEIWPEANRVDLVLNEFIDLKLARDAAGHPLNIPFVTTNADGKIISIKGNPDLGLVKQIMLGVRNPEQSDKNNPLRDIAVGESTDDGAPKCVEVWFNELRLGGLDEEGGVAALANMNIKMADLGTLNFSTSYYSRGFGQLEQKVDQRYQEDIWTYDLSLGLQLGKLLPKKAGLVIPFQANLAQSFSTPEYDPYRLDIPTEVLFDQLKATDRDSFRTYRRTIQDIETRRGFNFSNVRINPQSKKKKKIRFYSPQNFNLTYAYTHVSRSNPFIVDDSERTYKAAIGYNFSPQVKPWYPFKKMIKSRSQYTKIIKDFNLNYLPNTLYYGVEGNRRFAKLQLRQIGAEEFPIQPTFSKDFLLNRNYGIKFDPFRSLKIDFSAENASRIDEPFGELDTEEKRDSVWNNLLDGGRDITYNHATNISYTLPLNKIPFLSFLQVRTKYNSSFTWTSGPQIRTLEGDLIQDTRGNTINNTGNFSVNGDINMKKLYDKVPFLKTYTGRNSTLGDKEKNDRKRERTRKARERIAKERDKLKKKREKVKEDIKKLKEEISKIKADEDKAEDKKEKEIAQKEAEIDKKKKESKKLKKQIKKKRKSFRKKQYPSDAKIGFVLQPLLSLRKVQLQFSENRSTTLPGYLPGKSWLGMDYDLTSPGYDFVLGQQPGGQFLGEIDPVERDLWLDRAADEGWISSDTLLNKQFSQSYSRTLSGRATFEPWRDLQIDLSLKQSFTQNHTQLFKKTSEFSDWEHLNPIDIGTYSVSYLTFGTAFRGVDDNNLSPVYQDFLDNRAVISGRLGIENIDSEGNYFNPSDTTELANYRDGYGPYSQDVLIPAFLAAYRGQDAGNVTLNPLKQIPLPNWRITYNGLSKFKWAKKLFKSLNISSGYASTLNINSFETDLRYEGTGFNGPTTQDSFGNYYSQFNIPSVVINEQFSPLIGIDISWKNGITTKFDYKKSRTVTMNFADFQVIESLTEGITFGFGYRTKGFKFPFKIKGKQVQLKNDLNIRMDFTYRDNVTINNRIDQESIPTAGARIITTKPTIDYTVNKRLNLQFFYERNHTIPKTSQSNRMITQRGGVKIRFALTP